MDRIVRIDQAVIRDLELTGLHCHGNIYTDNSYRRSWALKQAAIMLDRKLKVEVCCSNLYLGERESEKERDD